MTSSSGPAAAGPDATIGKFLTQTGAPCAGPGVGMGNVNFFGGRTLLGAGMGYSPHVDPMNRRACRFTLVEVADIPPDFFFCEYESVPFLVYESFSRADEGFLLRARGVCLKLCFPF